MFNFNNNTNNAAAAAATANDQIQAGVERSKRFALITTGLVIYGGEAALSESVTSRQLTQQAKADCAKQAVKIGSVARAFLVEPLEKLENVRKDVNQLLEDNGARVPGLDGTFFVPVEKMKKVLTELNQYKAKFDNIISSIVAGYDGIVAETVSKLSAEIADDEVRKDAIARIPSKDEFEGRNCFSIQVFAVQAPSEGDEELAKLLEGSMATSIVTAEDAFKARLYAPFVEMAKNCSRKNYANVLGRKMSALKKALTSVEKQQSNLRLIFRSGDDAALLEKAFALLKEVDAHFLHEHPLANVKCLESWIVKKFWRVAEIFSGEKELRAFLDSGESLWADGFDLSNKKDMVAILNGAAPAPAAGEEGKDEEPRELDLFDQPASSEAKPEEAVKDGAKAEADAPAKDAEANAGVPCLADLLKAGAEERKLEEAAAWRAKALEEAQATAAASAAEAPDEAQADAQAEAPAKAEPEKAPADASNVDFSDPDQAAEFLSRNFADLSEVPDGMFAAGSGTETESAKTAEAEPEKAAADAAREVMESVSASSAKHEEEKPSRGFTVIFSDEPLF